MSYSLTVSIYRILAIKRLPITDKRLNDKMDFVI